MGVFNFTAWANQIAKLKMSVVTGANHGVNMALSGAVMTDLILGAVSLTDNATCSELPRITSAGNVQFPTSDAYNADNVLILWAHN